MDRLKHFIDTNRDAFEEEQLSEDHLERFEKRLPHPRRSLPIRYNLYAIIAAACISLLILFNLPWENESSKVSPTREQPCSCEIAEEFEGLRIHYTMQIHETIEEMKMLCKQYPFPGAKDLLDETDRILADNRLFEKSVLSTLPCSNDGLYAINMHYSSSLESLQIMLNQMESMKSNNQ